MNNVVLAGRIAREPEVRYSTSGNAVARFTVACNRRFKKEGQPEADFISCVAFGKTAEFIEKYFAKGSGIVLNGSIQTGSYEKDGKKVYTTDVLVDNVEFGAGSAKKEAKENIPEGFEALTDDDMPF